MRKTLYSLILLILGLLTTTSCDIDLVDNYSYIQVVDIALQEGKKEDIEKVRDELEKYILSCFETEKIEPFYGAQYDAVVKGCDIFMERVKLIDEDKVLEFLPKEGDAARYMIVISGQKMQQMIGYQVWVNEPEKEGGENQEGGSSNDGNK